MEMGVNPKLAGDSGTMADLSWENFIKEVFLDSDTSIALISTPPGPYPWKSVVPPKEMTHIRDEINRLTNSQRMLAHGLVMPQLGKLDLDFMDQQAETLKVDAWKCYTASPPKGIEHGWWLSDETIAYPMLEKAQALGITKICAHKGLPLGPVADYNHPRDILQAAKDFTKLDFLTYHSGFLGTSRINLEEAKQGEVPLTTEFCELNKKKETETHQYLHGTGLNIRPTGDYRTDHLCPFARTNPLSFWRRPSHLRNRFYLVWHTSMADRSFPPVSDSRGTSRNTLLPCPDQRFESEDLRAERSQTVSVGSGSKTEGLTEGLSEPD